MKLKIDIGTQAKKFSTLEVGDFFEHGGKIYVKTEGIWVSHTKPCPTTGNTFSSLECEYYNAFDFSRNVHCQFAENVHVHEIQDPVLKGSI